MIKRNISDEIKTLASEFPIVAILGPRQSGKTTLVRHIFPEYSYISLEDPDNRRWAGEDPRDFLRKYNQYAILDEIQRVPELFSYLQSHVDQINRSGIFIITGSHNYLLMEKITQSLAGRIGIATLLPFSIEEILTYNPDITLNELVFKGAYPRIYDKNIRPGSFYSSYLSTYIERDVRLLKNINNYDVFSKFIRIMAARTGQILNTKSISDGCGISHNTVKDWLSILITSYIVFLLHPYYKNFNKRLIKSPKIYFYDVGLVSYLLGIKDQNQYDTHYLKGSIFETFIISNLLKNTINHGLNHQFYYWREHHGKEIDLIIDDRGKIKNIEIKAGATFNKDFIKELKYFNQLAKKDPKNSYLIYSGKEIFPYRSINVTNWKNLGIIF